MATTRIHLSYQYTQTSRHSAALTYSTVMQRLQLRRNRQYCYSTQGSRTVSRESHGRVKVARRSNRSRVTVVITALQLFFHVFFFFTSPIVYKTIPSDFLQTRHYSVMLILVLKDSLRTKFKSLSLQV